MDEATFVREWAESLESGSAAVFVGAGLSRRAGYPDWRTLLTEIADDLHLDISTEPDLAALAQYALNRNATQRGVLTRLITKHFGEERDPPPPFRILARLPLRHIWTTNYDRLIEAAWRVQGKILDVKSDNKDLSFENQWAHGILYKMHGTVDHAADVVLARGDYELYRRTRPGFLQALAGDLVTRSILFVGLSFTDPNLSILFARIREAFREDPPDRHFAILRRPKRESAADSDEYEVNLARHELWVEDLRRYGIRSVEVAEYEDYDSALAKVEIKLASGSVFVSGSIADQVPGPLRAYAEAVAREVGAVIAKSKRRLVSGYGHNLGSPLVAAALSEILSGPTPNLERSLMLRPFPREAPAGMDDATFKQRYREGMVSQAGICVAICGLRATDGGEIVNAPGVIAEVAIAEGLGRTIIPIGATGGAAREIWLRLNARGYLPRGLSADDFRRLNEQEPPPSEIGAIVAKALRA